MKTLRECLVVFVLLSLITGVAYPVAITVISQVIFPHQANGSLIDGYERSSADERADEQMANRYYWRRVGESEDQGKLVGSELIGQTFSGPNYFWGRPSAASYNGGASTGSNYGPTNPAQLDAVKQRVADMKAAHESEGDVPVDLVTASGSGLDPHISPATANYQVNRIAQRRNLDKGKVRELVAEHTESRTFGVLGEPRVNVLKLNLALDGLAQNN